MNPWRHGTITGYMNHRCRCDDCKQAASTYTRERRNRGLPIPEHSHGSNSTYVNYRCRCQPCKDAHAAYHRQYQKQVKQ